MGKKGQLIVPFFMNYVKSRQVLYMPIYMAESEEELKSLLMKVKEESGKSWSQTQHSENEGHGIWSHHFMANRCGNSVRLYLWDSKITAEGDCSHEIETLAPWKESYDQPRQHIEKQRHYFVNKGLSSQGCGFSSGHVWMSELDYKES